MPLPAAAKLPGIRKTRSLSSFLRALRSIATVTLTVLFVVALRDGRFSWTELSAGAGRYWPVFAGVFFCLWIWEHFSGRTGWVNK